MKETIKVDTVIVQTGDGSKMKLYFDSDGNMVRVTPYKGNKAPDQTFNNIIIG